MSHLTFLDRIIIPTYDNEEYATTGRVTIDRDKCSGCGLCAQICPGKAIHLEGKGRERKACMEEVFPQCMSCNDCAAICEQGAVEVSRTYDFGYYYRAAPYRRLLPPRRF